MGFVQVENGTVWETCGTLFGTYLDGIIIFSTTFEEHIENTRKVLRRLREHGVKLKPRKYKLFKREVTFLGRVVSEEGYKLDPSCTKPGLELKNSPPKTVNEVRKLIGFLNYYRRYVKNFQELPSLFTIW